MGSLLLLPVFRGFRGLAALPGPLHPDDRPDLSSNSPYNRFPFGTSAIESIIMAFWAFRFTLTVLFRSSPDKREGILAAVPRPLDKHIDGRSVMKFRTEEPDNPFFRGMDEIRHDKHNNHSTTIFTEG
jgi:hypothetical protein